MVDRGEREGSGRRKVKAVEQLEVLVVPTAIVEVASHNNKVVVVCSSGQSEK